MKEKCIYIKLNTKDYNMLKTKSSSLKITMTRYIEEMINNGEVRNYEELNKWYYELNRIGNNLNQITKMAHQGSINVFGLEEMKEEVSKIWQLLNLLIQNPR